MNSKLLKAIDKYRKLLKLREKRRKANKVHGTFKYGNITKNKILDFFVKNNKWPSRLSNNKREIGLSACFENFVCPSSVSYDSVLRRIALAGGRKVNKKRKHNVIEFKKEILAFVEKHKRAPITHAQYEMVAGESKLRQKLDYYTQDRNDTTLLGVVYTLDPCHRSGIPSKYRSIINSSLDVDKPLIRLVK